MPAVPSHTRDRSLGWAHEERLFGPDFQRPQSFVMSTEIPTLEINCTLFIGIVAYGRC